MNFIKEWINKIIQRNSKVNRLESNIAEQEIRLCKLEEKEESFTRPHCTTLFNTILEDNKELKKRVENLEEKVE